MEDWWRDSMNLVKQKINSATYPLKRPIDLCIAGVVGLLALPLLVVIAIWIKFISPDGPVLFTQERVGENEKNFLIYKFRTMHVGSEKHALGSVTVKNDPRIIGGGRLMRSLKLDELPQLLNVLRGNMSIVGPRPTVETDYGRMTPRQRQRALAKPGLTGLAQVNGAAGLYWPERIEYDLKYIKTVSFVLDLKILFKTLLLVVSRQADVNPVDGDEWGHVTGDESSAA